jgi:hypothetical protein
LQVVPSVSNDKLKFVGQGERVTWTLLVLFVSHCTINVND